MQLELLSTSNDDEIALKKRRRKQNTKKMFTNKLALQVTWQAIAGAIGSTYCETGTNNNIICRKPETGFTDKLNQKRKMASCQGEKEE